MTPRQLRDEANGPWEGEDALYILAEAVALDYLDDIRRCNGNAGFISKPAAPRTQRET